VLPRSTPSTRSPSQILPSDPTLPDLILSGQQLWISVGGRWSHTSHSSKHMCALESACCKRLFFQMFHRYVVIVSCECCKSRSGCCICCNGCTLMLQAFIPNVSSVFSGRVLQLCLSGCCICSTHMLHVFLFGYYVWLQWFSSVFQVCFLSVS
jgi:hypothetical protein